MIDIYNKLNNLIGSVIMTDECERRKSLQNENRIIVRYSSDTRVVYPALSYIIYEGEKFFLIDEYKPVYSNGVYSYEIVFVGVEELIACSSFFLYVSTGSPDHSESQEAEFNLNADLKTIADVFLTSLQRSFPDINWSVSSNIPEESENKPLSYSQMKIKDALDYTAEEFDTEWWFDGYTLHLEKCERGDYIELGREPGYGLNDFTYDSSERKPSRLYVYGSKRNISREINESNIPYNTRLQLPNGQKYIEVPGVNNNVESIKFFEDIYPRRVGTITSVRVGGTTQSPIYYFTDDNIDFKIDLIEGTTTLSVHFESGHLNGRDFELGYPTSNSNEFEIINNQDNDIQIPYGVLIPQIGDKYVLYGMMMPDKYITLAQDELLTEANKYVDELSRSYPAINCISDAVYFNTYGKAIDVGSRIRLIDDDFALDQTSGKRFLQSRVTEFSYKLTSKDNVTFKLAKAISAGALATIRNEISEQENTIDGIYQNSRAISARGWRDTKELSEMIDSLQADLVLVGNPDGQFTTTCFYQANYKNDKNLLFISSGQLQHVVYTDNPSGGIWNIETSTHTIATESAYYLYAECLKSGNSANTILSTSKKGHTDNYYYFLLGVLSSVFEFKRTLNIVSGFTQIAGGSITTEKIQDSLSRLVIDLSANPPKITAKNGAIIEGEINFKSSSSWQEVQTQIDDAENTANIAKSLSETANNYIDNVLPGNLEYLQNQIDGQVESWFMPHTPTLTNEPAINWETDLDKQRHIGDTFTNTQEYINDSSTPDAGKSWRFVSESGTYKWTPIADSDAVKALKEAAKAQDTADGKRRVFTQTPTTPYEIGDLWAQGPSGDLMRCVKSRLSGNYVSSDWDKANKYTDDTIANAAKSAAEEAKTAADNAQNSANNAISNINIITDDNIFSATEKKQLLPEWNSIVNEKKDLESTADKYDITDRKTSYLSAYTSIYNYVNPLMSKPNTHSPADGVPFNGATFRAKFETFYNARNSLYREIEGKAKEIAYNLGLPGRNFALKTGKSITLTGMSGISNDARELYSVLSEATGGDVTLSADVNISGCTFGNNSLIQFQGGASWNYELGMWLQVPLSNGKHHISLSGNIVSQSEDGKIYLRMDSVTGGTITISNLKFERGNEETEWVMAHEDTQSDLSYLTGAFPNSETDIAGGIVLSSFMGVRGNNNTVTSGMNGNANNALPLLFAGAPNTSGSLPDRAANALFSVRNDGTGRWSIFSIDKDRIVIKDSSDNTSVIISNKTIAEESNAEGGTVNQVLTMQNIFGRYDNISIDGYHFEYPETALTPNITLVSGNWDNKITISYNWVILTSSKISITDYPIMVYITIRVYMVNINDSSEKYLVHEKQLSFTDNAGQSSDGIVNETKDLSIYVGNISTYRFTVETQGAVYNSISSNPLNVSYQISPIDNRFLGTKNVNQNIIASDGISIVYNADQFFEIKKVSSRVVIRASLPLESAAISGQLCRDSNGYVKLKK